MFSGCYCCCYCLHVLLFIHSSVYTHKFFIFSFLFAPTPKATRATRYSIAVNMYAVDWGWGRFFHPPEIWILLFVCIIADGYYLGNKMGKSLSFFFVGSFLYCSFILEYERVWVNMPPQQACCHVSERYMYGWCWWQTTKTFLPINNYYSALHQHHVILLISTGIRDEMDVSVCVAGCWGLRELKALWDYLHIPESSNMPYNICCLLAGETKNLIFSLNVWWDYTPTTSPPKPIHPIRNEIFFSRFTRCHETPRRREWDWMEILFIE